MERRRETILLIERKGNWRDLLHQVIERIGYDALGVDNPEDIPRAMTARPDLILLDLDLLRESAEAVVSKIHQDPATRDVPIICQAIYGNSYQIDRIISAGAREVLYKPFDLSDLPSILRENLAHTESLNCAGSRDSTVSNEPTKDSPDRSRPKMIKKITAGL